jgi:hypothetical protein
MIRSTIPVHALVKSSFGILMALSLFLPVAAQERFPEVHLRVNGIGSGTARSKIIESIGKPQRERSDGIDECGDSGKMRTLSYPGLTIGVLGDARGRNYKVWKIDIVSGRWKIHPDLALGATKRRVRATLGPAIKENDDPNELLYVTRENQGLVSFHFKAGRLIRVSMQEALC